MPNDKCASGSSTRRFRSSPHLPGLKPERRKEEGGKTNSVFILKGPQKAIARSHSAFNSSQFPLRIADSLGIPSVKTIILLCFSFCATAVARAPVDNEPLQKLASDFWNWRAQYAPFTGDDVNRLERPGGLRDWSAAAIEQRRADLAGFETRWKALQPNHWPIAEQVDYRLMGSAF